MRDTGGILAPRSGVFDAFISYARTASGAEAEALHRAVERCAKAWYQKRSCHVFRDDAVMSAGVSLGESIEAALREATWLIVVASPAAAASVWVDREIRSWWSSHQDAARIILVHGQGHIAWDRAAKDFSSSADAVPAALRGRFASEPRWVDLTWFDSSDSSGAEDPRFVEVVQQIAAPILGIPRDEIGGHAAVQHRRTMRIARAAIAALSILLVTAVVSGVLAVLNGNEARNQLRVATSQQLAAQSLTLRSSDLATAQQLAVGGFHLDDNSQTRAALLGAAAEAVGLETSIPLPFPATVVQALPGGDTYLLGGSDGQIAILDVPSRSVKVLGPFGLGSEPTCMSASPDGSVVVVCLYDNPGQGTGRVFRDGTPDQVVSGTSVRGIVNADGTVTMAASDSSTGETTVYRLDAAHTSPQVLTSIPGSYVPEMTTTTDGSVLLGFGLSRSADRCYLALRPDSGEPVRWGYVHVPVESFMASGDPLFPVLDSTTTYYAAINTARQGWTLESGFAAALDLGVNDPRPSCGDVRETSATPVRSQISIPQKPTAIAVAPGADVFAVADGGSLTVYRTGSQGRPQEAIATFTGAGSVQQGRLFLPDTTKVISVTESAANVWRLQATDGLVARVAVVRTDEARQETYCTSCQPAAPVLSPGGRVVVTRADVGQASTWYDTQTKKTSTFSGEVVRWATPTSAIVRRDPEEWVTITDGVETGAAIPTTTVSPQLPSVSPDGTLRASVSDDQRLIITDIRSSSEIARIDVAGDRVKDGAIGFAVDGSFVAFDQWDLDGNSAITLVNLQPTDWINVACVSAQGPLSTATLAKFLPNSALAIRTCPSK